ncbi:MAG: cobalamin B12-binding domain-containing protein [Pseudomonadota bacterium]
MLDKSESLAKKRIVAEILHGKILPSLFTDGKFSGCTGMLSNGATFKFSESDVSALAALLVEGNTQEVDDLLASFVDVGCPATSLILGLLADTACRLGAAWSDDKLSFADVTVGMSGLHCALNSLDHVLSAELPRVAPQRSVLLVSPRGDTHIFGVAVLETFFRNAGWTVETALKADEQDVLKLVGQTAFDLVGLSVSRDVDLLKAKSLIGRIRRKSRNENVKALVGGSLISGNKDLVRRLGADATADNALHALEVASSICTKKLLVKSA